MKKMVTGILALMLAASAVGCGTSKTPHGDFDYISSEPAVSSEAINEEGSHSSESAEENDAPEIVKDPISDLGKKIQEIVASKFSEADVQVDEYHPQSDQTNKNVSASITVKNVTDSVPDNFIEAAKSAFASSKIADSQYSSLSVSIGEKDKAGSFATLVITKSKDSDDWSSSIVAYSGPYKDKFQLAYEKSAFFSDLDLMKQPEKAFDEIRKEYGIE
jgi:hypothetical protein